MHIHIPEVLAPLIDRFQAHGQPLYLVGGSVRNALLSLPPSDIDVCGPAQPEEVMRLLDGSPIRVVPIAPAFGTIQLHIPAADGAPSTVVEYTTFRSDRYDRGGTHRPAAVQFSHSLEHDAFRRDFSINALYATLPDGEVIDPCGGLRDLAARQLRTTSDHPGGILQDDALRTLRLVRFGVELGFGIEAATFESAKHYAPQLADIAVERIWKELKKILLGDVRYGAPQPGGQAAHERGLFMMLELGLLSHIFPELLEGQGIEQLSTYHAYDVLTHNLKTCGFSRPLLAVRLAALLHDVGKPRALRENGRMLGHDRMGAGMAEQMLKRLKVDAVTTARTKQLVEVHMLDLNNNAKLRTLRKHFARMGAEMAAQFADIREADFLGSGKQSSPIESAERYRTILAGMLADGSPFSANELEIDGREIAAAAGIAPGPLVGQIKHRLWMHCAAYPADNHKRRLLRLAHHLAVTLQASFPLDAPIK